VASRPTVVPFLIALVALPACRDRQPGQSKTPAVALPAGLPPGEVQSTGDPRAALFLAKGCPQCHSISALGVKSPNDIGPDLTAAYSDVQSRFSVKLEDFLPNPTGTMQMVLGQLIKLSPAERDSILHILTRLHEEQEHKP
jgi:cytochrome c1